MAASLALGWLAPGGLSAADDEAAVREIVRRYVDARESRDEKAIAGSRRTPTS
jgi:hypothetical protein